MNAQTRVFGPAFVFSANWQMAVKEGMVKVGNAVCMIAEPFAMPPSGVVTNERWRLRGAHDDAIRIPEDGWSYPYSSGVTVLSLGEIRTDILERDFPRAFEEDLSLFPLASRHLLPEGRQESVFWHAATPSNTLLATWWNAALGRVATNVVSFQAELFSDGGFAYRYEDRTVRHVRVWPFDLDDDGLENSVDPEPLVAGADAHGTNAEWCNVVCSNLFEAAEGGASSWRDGVNSNAYYFVDVVASDGPAPIYFAGDRASRLGNPVVVARGGETNRVPLLMGVEYSVTSTVPFAVSLPATGFASVTTNGASRYEVKWPLEFGFAESVGESNRVYTVTVEPYDPGGDFTWDVAGGGMRSGTSPGCNCGCLHCGGRFAWFTCSSTCTCDGGCQAVGLYCLENAFFSVVGGGCRCGFDDPSPMSQMGNGNTPLPSFSVSFSAPAVMFEETYENSPGAWCQRRSTRVRLSIGAYGGPNGGTITLTSTNLGKLAPIGCGPLVLPSSIAIGPHENYSLSFMCEANSQSDVANDITASGTFTENGTGAAIPAIQWVASGNGTVSNSLPTCYMCPIRAERGGILARIASVSYAPQIIVVEPQELICTAYGFLPADPLMGVGMALELKVRPLDVAFDGLQLQEVAAPPNATSPEWGIHEGYFNDYAYTTKWYHYAWWGSGTWVSVLPGNRFGGYDQSRMHNWPQPWGSGRMTWVIPIAWKSRHSSGSSGDGQLEVRYTSEWTMTDEYVIKTKHQQTLTVMESGLVFLNGERCEP